MRTSFGKRTPTTWPRVLRSTSRKTFFSISRRTAQRAVTSETWRCPASQTSEKRSRALPSSRLCRSRCQYTARSIGVSLSRGASTSSNSLHTCTASSSLLFMICVFLLECRGQASARHLLACHSEGGVCPRNLLLLGFVGVRFSASPESAREMRKEGRAENPALGGTGTLACALPSRAAFRICVGGEGSSKGAP